MEKKKEDIKHIDTKEEVAAYGIKTFKEILSNGSLFIKFLVALVICTLCCGAIIGVIYALKQLF